MSLGLSDRLDDARVHVLHVVYSFTFGGLENVVVQLINNLPHDRFRHSVLALTTVGDFRDRVQVPGVEFIALNKPAGHALPLYPAILALLRRLRPDVMHSCNLAALELVPLAWLARVPLRVHVEHGWDAHDLSGESARYQRLRRMYRPFVSRYVAVSADLERYLGRRIGVPDTRRKLIPNGVDTRLFRPASEQPGLQSPMPFRRGEHFVFGTVGRMQTVKNQPLLARAFVHLKKLSADGVTQARLAMVGEGPLMGEVQSVLGAAGLLDQAWLPGARSDVCSILPNLDAFVLPSLTEGTSCTLQEAMACGVPAIATAVGGTPGLVKPGTTGWLIPTGDEASMAEAMLECMQDEEKRRDMGNAARRSALAEFSLESMIREYSEVFCAAS